MRTCDDSSSVRSVPPLARDRPKAARASHLIDRRRRDVIAFFFFDDAAAASEGAFSQAGWMDMTVTVEPRSATVRSRACWS